MSQDVQNKSDEGNGLVAYTAVPEQVTHKINCYDTFAGTNLAQRCYQHLVERFTCQSINTNGRQKGRWQEREGRGTLRQRQ